MLKRIPNKKHSAQSVEFDNRNSNFMEHSPVSEFYFEKSIADSTGEEVIHVVDPIYLLFNQDRLSKLGIDGVKNYLDSLLQQSTSPLDSLRKQCSDEDLLATIKSRHLQSPSEILSWSRYMSNNIDKFNSLVEEVKQQSKQQVQQTDSSAAAE